jgi:low affinity Fe/Cu permease
MRPPATHNGVPEPERLPRRRRQARAGRRAASRRLHATRGGLVSALEHPADRIEHHRGRFASLAERASFLASSPLFFVLCAALVLAWVVGLATGASDRFEAAAAGLMSATTLILVALLRNAELRAERALQTKLDAIASSLLEDRRGHAGDAEVQLERSIGVHEQI